MEARPGVDGGHSLAPGAALPPLVLDDDEAVALAVGLQAAAQAPVAGMTESSVQALAKVVQVMPVRLRRRVDALRAVTVPAGWGAAAPSVDPGVLTTVALACRDGERLRFGYTDAGGHPNCTSNPSGWSRPAAAGPSWPSTSSAAPGAASDVTMAAENLDWAVFALGVTGAAIDEVHLSELLEHLQSWGARLAAATAGAP